VVSDQRERFLARSRPRDHVAGGVSSHVGVGLATEPRLEEVAGSGLVLVARDGDEFARQIDESHTGSVGPGRV